VIGDHFLTRAVFALCNRVSERSHVDRSTANYQSQQIVATLADVIPPGNVEKVRNQLPEDFESLFELTDLAAEET
jgi:uncharacterized protein (DUF2267 family)